MVWIRIIRLLPHPWGIFPHKTRKLLHIDISEKETAYHPQKQQEAISQKEIVFRFRKDVQSEKGWGLDILCLRRPEVKGICANGALWPH